MSDLKIQGVVEMSSEGAERAFDRIGQKSDEMSRKVVQTSAQAGQAVDQIGEGANRSADDFTRSEKRIVESIKRATTNLQMLGKTASQRLELNIDTKGLDRAKFEPLLANLRELERSQTRITGSSVGMRGGMQNLSYQMQDFIAQVNGGTAATTALSMQLPQLLGAFGAFGAGLGVVAALLPNLIGLFSDSANEAGLFKDAMSGLDSAISDVGRSAKTFDMDELYKEFNRSGESARLATIEQIKFQKALIETQRLQARKSFGESLDDVSMYGNFDDMAGGVAISGLARELAVAGEMARDLLPALRGLKSGTADAGEVFDRFGTRLLSGNKAAFTLATSLRDLAQGERDAEAAAAALNTALEQMATGKPIRTKDDIKEAGDAAKRAAKEAERLKEASQDLVASLLGQSSGLSADFFKKWETLGAAYKAGAISLQDLTNAQAALLAQQPAMKQAAKDAEEYGAALAASIGVLEERALVLETELRNYGLTKSQIEHTTVARLEEARAMAAAKGASDEYLRNLDREIAARKRIAEATASIEVEEANAKAAKDAEQEWKRTADNIEKSLVDALMDGGKSGAEYIEGLFRTMVLRPVLQAVVSPVANAITGILGFGAPGRTSTGGTSILGTANSAYSLYNGASNLYNTGAIGYQWATGAMSGANAAGTLYANATGTSMDGLFASTGWGTSGSAAGASGMMSSLASAGAYAAIAMAVVSLIGDIFGDDPDPRLRYKMSSDLGDTSGWEDGVAYAEGPFGYVGLDEASTREVKGRKFKEQLAALAAFDTMLASVMSRDEVAAVRSGMDGWMSSADRDARDYRRDPDLSQSERLLAISESAGGEQWEEVLEYIRGTQLGSDTGWVTDENGFVTQPNLLPDGTTIADLYGLDNVVTSFADAGEAGAIALQDALRGVAAESVMDLSGYSYNEGVSQTWLDEQVAALIGDMPQSLDDLSIALQGFGLTVEEVEKIAINAANAPFGTGRAGADMANAAQLDGEALAQFILRGFQADNVQSMLEKVGQDIGRDAARAWMDASTTTVVGEDGKETSLDGYGVLMEALATNYAALYQTQESAWKQAQENLADMFDEIGVSVPASIDAFKRLTEAQDLNTEAGRKLYSELWGLAPAFLEVANAVEQTFASISKTTAESIREIEMSILDNAGKYEYLDTEIGSLLEKLSAATDPATIQGLFEQINSKTTQAFNLLDGDEQKRLATDFIDRLYEAESVAQSRLSVTPIDYQPQQDAATKQSEAAVKQEEAAAKLVAAAEKIMTALGLMEGHSEEGAGALIVAGQQLRAAATHLSNAVAGEQSTEMR